MSNPELIDNKVTKDDESDKRQPEVELGETKSTLENKGHILKKLSLTKELVEKQYEKTSFEEKCLDLEYRIKKVEENLERMIKSMVKKKIIAPTKSMQSLVNSEKSEVIMSTLDLNKQSSIRFKTEEDKEPAGSLKQNVEQIERDFKDKVNSLMKIKDTLSDYTLKLNQIKSVNDASINCKSAQFKPTSILSLTNSKIFKNPNKHCKFIRSSTSQ